MRIKTDEDYERDEPLISCIEIIYPDAADAYLAYTRKQGCSFEYVKKFGEMNFIMWIRVHRDNKLIAEIKESNCNIFFKGGE